MLIELFDMDVPYQLSIDCNDEGKDFVRIAPNSMYKDRTEDYDICLDENGIDELIASLLFLKAQTFKR